MNKLTLWLPGLILSVCGCAASYAPVAAIEKIHREPKPGEVCLSNPNQSLLRYVDAPVFEPKEGPEKAEDPVGFCRDRIDSLRGIDEDDPRVRGAAVYVLSYTASLSPAALVRADAIRALTLVCDGGAAGFRYAGAEVDPDAWDRVKDAWIEHAARAAPAAEIADRSQAELAGAAPADVRRPAQSPDWPARRERMRQLRAEREAFERGLPADEQRAILDLLAEIGGWRFETPKPLWRTLQYLGANPAPAMVDARVAEAYDAAMAALVDQALFLTARDGLFDGSRLVCRESIAALSTFPPTETAAPFGALLEVCFDGPMRIQVLENFKRPGLDPRDLGGRLMQEVRRSIDYSDPGVVFHAVALLKSLTGIHNSDPAFWREWWSEYLPEHADELSARAPSASGGAARRPKC